MGPRRNCLSSGRARGGSLFEPLRALTKAQLMWNSDFRVLSAIRRLLLSFTILGLLLAPSAGFAHGAMQQGQVIGMADHSPCCPESPVDDCPKCAFMTSCALFCVDYLATEQSIAMVVWRHAAPVTAGYAQTFAGVDHPPPRKPPRS